MGKFGTVRARDDKRPYFSTKTAADRGSLDEMTRTSDREREMIDWIFHPEVKNKQNVADAIGMRTVAAVLINHSAQFRPLGEKILTRVRILHHAWVNTSQSKECDQVVLEYSGGTVKASDVFASESEKPNELLAQTKGLSELAC